MSEKLPITVILLTLNEAHNLEAALDHILPWVGQVFIVDSLSMDRTIDIALARGVPVVQRPFTNFGDQWNWALDNLPIETAWTMKLDPDERVTPALRDEFARVVNSHHALDGYSFRRRLWFMAKPLHQTQWVLRLWKTGRCRFADVMVNEHPLIDGVVGELSGLLEHYDSPTLHHWTDKQNFYSTMRAMELVRPQSGSVEPRLFGDALQRRMLYKKWFFRLPLRHAIMWLYLAFGRGALRDGKTGVSWINQRVQVYRLADYKAREMRHLGEIPSMPKRPLGHYDPRVVASDLQKQLQPQAESHGPVAVPPSAAGRDRLRLAVDAVSLAPGGGLVVLLGYLRAWQQLGSDLDIRVYTSRKAVHDAVAAAVPEIELSPFAVGCSKIHRFTLQQTRLGQVIDQAGADVVLTTNAMVGRCQCPQLVLHQNLKRFWHRRLGQQLRHGGLAEAVRDITARRALRHSAMNVFITDYLREQAELFVPESRPRNHVIHNGVSQALIDRAAEPAGEFTRGQLIAIQGAAVHKDTPTLLRTLARLVALRPDVPWRLKFAGVDKSLVSGELVEQLGIDDRIDYLGYVDHEQLDILLRRSQCLIFTSQIEGFGLPPLEAMARRCPAVVCNATALPEVVGDAAIAVPPGDAEGFAQAVLRLAEEPGLREQYVERGVARVSQFSWLDSARRMTELLKRASVSLRR